MPTKEDPTATVKASSNGDDSHGSSRQQKSNAGGGNNDDMSGHNSTNASPNEIGNKDTGIGHSKKHNGSNRPTASSASPVSPNDEPQSASSPQPPPSSANSSTAPNSNTDPSPNFQTITITAQDISSASIVSIVDPWVPRLRNDDEYLHRGLDFSPKKKKEADNSANSLDPGNASHPETQEENSSISPVVGDIGATRLSEALTHNTRLLYLNLSRNDIGNEGGMALAKCLYAPIKSRTSSINSNSSSVSGDAGNGQLYRSKTVLRVLNLSHNSISSISTMMQFAQALRYNKSLKELKLNSNSISLEGMVILLSQGLEYNKKLIRLSLADNIRAGELLSGSEMNRIVDSLVRILCRGCEEGGTALEVLEMHNTSNVISIDNKKSNSTPDKDNFHTLSNNNIRRLHCSMYGKLEGTEFASRCDMYGVAEEKIKNHRFRRLTLPPSTDNSLDNDENAKYDMDNGRSNSTGSIEQKRHTAKVFPRKQHALRCIFAFNNYHRPILQLFDILNSPLAQAERSLSVPIKLPKYLQRDVHTGALIGLLPSSSSSTNESAPSVVKEQQQAVPSSNVGIEYRLMPQVLAFVCSECSLVTIWNAIRYRPDIFCCVGSNIATTMVECAPCGSLFRGGDGGCCMS